MDLRGVALVTRGGTVVTELAAAPADAAAGTPRGHQEGQPVPRFDLDTMPGTGDLWSTAADVTTFTAALHAGELITDGSLRAMCTPHAPVEDEDPGEPRMVTTGYGYGMFTGTFGGHATYYHPGDNRVTCPSRAGYRTGQHRGLGQRRERRHGGPAQAATAHRTRTVALAGLVAGTHDDEEE
jgi:CubicO group peptidase (beta-lactamase class C family)